LKAVAIKGILSSTDISHDFSLSSLYCVQRMLDRRSAFSPHNKREIEREIVLSVRKKAFPQDKITRLASHADVDLLWKG
jgi:hypothetical protein